VTIALERQIDSPESVPAAPHGSVARATTGWLGTAGVASLGAGAIHAAAIGVHAEHRPAAVTFAVLALLQVGWGALALVRSTRVVAVSGIALSAAAVGGWILAKTSGIGFVDGLDVTEPVQTADALAAGLALAAALVGLAALLGRGAGEARRPLALSAVAVSALTLLGMVTGGTHVHAGSEAGHGHDVEVAAGADHHADEPAPAVATVPYDPTKPIDLGGVPGVTPEQQAAAENLVAVTILRLPKWSDPAYAEANGFRSIGDGRTGTEHLVSQEFMNDDSFLDPDRPESLVYDTQGGGRRLVAAMYMAERGLPLEDVPNIGGKLMQWHTHENLCYNAQGKVAGLTNAAGECPPGLVKPVPTPMIHVWIEPHPCGPFAALEGIAGGRIPDGETKLCDHAHGS
jgi:hypothetical protein